jgi:hypothetical protein
MVRPSEKFADSDRKSQTTQLLLKAELATGHTLAGIAQTKRQVGDDEGGKLARARAEKIYSELGRFLSDPKHAKHLTDEKRRDLMVGMKRLREKLDGLTPGGGTQAETELQRK